MPFAEQLLYGSDDGDRKNRRILAQSPGLGKSVAGEIRQLCEGWGVAPVAGLDRPALISMPLKNSLASMRGRLYTIIQVGTGPEPTHHAIVITEADYAAFGHNPYALPRAFDFLGGWRVGIILDRRAFDEVPDTAIVVGPPEQADLAVVTESLRQILVKGRIQLPLTQPGIESDHVLALIIAGLPNPLRRELRFASFTASESNNHTLCAMSTPNCTFRGWQRLLLAEVAAIVPEEVDAYANKVGACITAGDLPGLCRQGRDQTTIPGARKPEGALDPIRPTAAAVPRRSAPPRPEQPPRPSVPPARTMSSKGQAKASENNRKTPRKTPRKAPRTSRLVQAGTALRVRGGGRPRRGRVVPMVVAGVLMVAALWWRMPDLEQLVMDRWDGFAGRSAAEGDHATTLLQVIDVGAVYDREIQRLSQAGFMGHGDGQRDRHRAIVTLQTDVAAPLLKQTDLFTALAAEGIQQAGRPDRELARMSSLDAQGIMLDQELKRLELAWLSLSRGIDWQDLGQLGDKEVSARRDSVRRTDKTAIAAAARELGTVEATRRIAKARRQVAGMADLLTLFQATTWSPRWEKKLATAAERVSPRASSATRAYRNSAFAFMRLKRAERIQAAHDIVYTEDFRDGVWPAREVADVLPDLRQEVARFGRNAAPSLLSGTLDLYSALAKPASLARKAAQGDALAKLAANPAVRFDPETYADQFARIRFEAAGELLETGVDSTGLPEHLFRAGETEMVRRFHTNLNGDADAQVWWAEQELQAQPFLARWAGRLAKEAFHTAQERQQGFDAAWSECVRLQRLVRSRAIGGTDWTAVWLDLHEQVGQTLDDYARDLGGDPRRASRLAQLAEVKGALEESRELVLDAVTIRLPQGALDAPVAVTLELGFGDAGGFRRSSPLTVGPSAPAGSGWVGTADLGWHLPVGMDDALSGRVLGTDGEEIFAVQYPSLRERVGAGALARARGDAGFTISFQVDVAWWHGLELQPLE